MIPGVTLKVAMLVDMEEPESREFAGLWCIQKCAKGCNDRI